MLDNQKFEEMCKHKSPGEWVGGQGWLDTADMYQHLKTLYALVYGFPDSPKILEIGVSDGTSSLAFLKALDERPDQPTPNLQSVDVSDCQQLAIKSIEHFGYSNRWNFHLMTSDEYFANHQESKFNIILIDGDHKYSGAKRDFDNAIKRLEPGGVILIHDSYMHQDHGEDGCSKLVYEIIMDNNFCCFTSPVLQNMTFIQRKSDVLARMEPWKK